MHQGKIVKTCLVSLVLFNTVGCINTSVKTSPSSSVYSPQKDSYNNVPSINPDNGVDNSDGDSGAENDVLPPVEVVDSEKDFTINRVSGGEAYYDVYDPQFNEKPRFKNNPNLDLTSDYFVNEAQYRLYRTLSFNEKSPYEEKYSHQNFANAMYAWDRGLTGKGVNIGIIDSGVNFDHEELKGKVDMEKSFIITDKFVANKEIATYDGLETVIIPANDAKAVGELNLKSDSEHGTHVAGLAAGKTVGIAPEAKLSIAKAFVNYYDAEYDESYLYNSVVNSAQAIGILNDGGSRVINLSMTGFETASNQEEYQTLLENVADRDLAVIVAAGNFALNFTDDLYAPLQQEENANTFIYTHNPLLKDKLIYVGSTFNDYVKDGRYILADFSNYPGDDKTIQGRFIVANGYYVLSADANSNVELVTNTGTSMAAPVVSGAVALLLSSSANLAAEDAMEILLKTADRNFLGYDPYYFGMGVLDLKNALSPYGLPRTSVSGLTSYDVRKSKLHVPQQLSAKLKSQTSLSSVAIYDDYDRAFQINLAELALMEGKEQGVNLQNGYAQVNSGFKGEQDLITLGNRFNVALSPLSTSTSPMMKIRAGAFSVSNYHEDEISVLGFEISEGDNQSNDIFASINGEQLYFGLQKKAGTLHRQNSEVKLEFGAKGKSSRLAIGLKQSHNQSFGMEGVAAFGVGDVQALEVDGFLSTTPYESATLFSKLSWLKQLDHQATQGGYITSLSNVSQASLIVGATIQDDSMAYGIATYTIGQILSGKMEMVLPKGVSPDGIQQSQHFDINLAGAGALGVQSFFKRTIKNTAFLAKASINEEVGNLSFGAYVSHRW
jgi:subtilisin family serine protease